MKGPRRGSLAAALQVVTCGLATLAGGCARQHEAASVSLPDLSRLATSVQAQIGERHAALRARLGDPTRTPAELGGAYGELGLILMAAEYYEFAASCFRTAQALVPADGRWPYYLGQLFRIRGDGAKAAEYFSEALKLRPDDAPTLIWLAETYLDQGRPDQAEPLFLKVLSEDSSSAAALAGVGRAALAKRDLRRAADYLERALAAEPRALGLHYSLAAAYRGLGQLDRAKTHLERRGNGRPVPRDPLMEAYEAALHSPLTFEIRGVQALERRQLKEAADLFRRGLELAPDDPALLHRLGTALFMAGDAMGAVHQFEAALRHAPEYSRAHFGLGMVFNLQGRHAEAVDRFSAAVKYQPTYLEARLGLIEALRATGRLQESLPHFERIVELEPGFAEAWVMYATTLVRLQRYQEARDRLNEARRIHPEQRELKDLLDRIHARDVR